MKINKMSGNKKSYDGYIMKEKMVENLIEKWKEFKKNKKEKDLWELNFKSFIKQVEDDLEENIEYYNNFKMTKEKLNEKREELL